MKTLIISLVILAVMFMIFFPIFRKMMREMNEIRKIEIKLTDASKLADGTYRGSFHKSRWNYELEIDVKAGKITAVRNNVSEEDKKNFHSLDGKITEVLLQKQSIPFDAVSGATVDTRAYLKAVENALAK